MSTLPQKLMPSVEVPDAASVTFMPVSRSPARAVLDLVQLARRSRGDRALELELLGHFDRQALLAGARLRAAADAGAGVAVGRMLAATARIAGAFAVAAACDDYLAALGDGLPVHDRLRVLDSLDAEIVIARAAISDLVPQDGR